MPDDISEFMVEIERRLDAARKIEMAKRTNVRESSTWKMSNAAQSTGHFDLLKDALESLGQINDFVGQVVPLTNVHPKPQSSYVTLSSAEVKYYCQKYRENFGRSNQEKLDTYCKKKNNIWWRQLFGLTYLIPEVPPTGNSSAFEVNYILPNYWDDKNFLEDMEFAAENYEEINISLKHIKKLTKDIPPPPQGNYRNASRI